MTSQNSSGFETCKFDEQNSNFLSTVQKYLTGYCNGQDQDIVLIVKPENIVPFDNTDNDKLSKLLILWKTILNEIHKATSKPDVLEVNVILNKCIKICSHFLTNISKL